MIIMLVVENNNACAKLISFMLQKKGVGFEIVNDKHVALKKCALKKYDGLILNILPNDLSQELELTAIRKLINQFQSQVIVTTACALPDIITEIEGFGVSKILVKPLRPTDFEEL